MCYRLHGEDRCTSRSLDALGVFLFDDLVRAGPAEHRSGLLAFLRNARDRHDCPALLDRVLVVGAMRAAHDEGASEDESDEGETPGDDGRAEEEIGRASCRERVE